MGSVRIDYLGRRETERCKTGDGQDAHVAIAVDAGWIGPHVNLAPGLTKSDQGFFLAPVGLNAVALVAAGQLTAFPSPTLLLPMLNSSIVDPSVLVTSLVMVPGSVALVVMAAPWSPWRRPPCPR
jgi:hypothetical protein